MIRPIKTSLVALLALTVTGCGGGGSDSGSGGGSTPPPTITEPSAPTVNYSGNQQPAILDKQNAPDFAAAVLSIRSLMQLGEGLYIPLPLSTRGAIDETITGSGGGTANISGNINSHDVGFLVVEYRNFSEAGLTIDGRYIQRYRTAQSSPGVIYSDLEPGTLEFDNVSISTAGGNLLLRGVMRLSGGNLERFEMNLLVEDTGSGQSWYYESAAIDFTTETLGSGQAFGLALSGTIYESTMGSAEVTATEPLLDLGVSEQNGYLLAEATGGFRIASAGPLLEFRSLTPSYAAIMLDFNGDGLPEEGRRFAWAELAGLPEPGTSVGIGPIANAGTERWGHAGEQFTVHGLFSHDDDGDWLTYHWSLVSRPIGSALTLEEPTSPVQVFVPDVPGSYVFTLETGDGTNWSETSVLANVVDGQPGLPVAASYGALEVMPPFAPGAPIIVDGRGAAHFPHNPRPLQWWSEGPGIRNLNETNELYKREFTTDRHGHFQVHTSISGKPQASSQAAFAVGDIHVSMETDWIDDDRARDFVPNDFNQDGITDLAVRLHSGSFQLFAGLGNGNYEPQTAISAGSGEIATGDLNNDGLPDFAVADVLGVHVALQAPDNTFDDFTLHEFPDNSCLVPSVRDIGILDVNGDGRDDLAAVQGCDASLQVWLQNASGDLNAPLPAITAERVTKTVFADIDGDGRDDAVFLAQQFDAVPAALVVATGQADGRFTVRERIETANGFAVTNFGVGDINIDGRQDLLVFSNAHIATIFEQQADQSWQTVNAGSIGSIDGTATIRAAQIVDIDDDGDMDFLMCGLGRELWVGTRQQDSSYLYAEVGICKSETISDPNTIAVMDFNGDGTLDILANSDSTTVFSKIYLGDITSHSRTSTGPN